jgi:hypothetical protein
MRFLPFALVIASVAAIWSTPQAFPRTTINLDLEPEVRYTALITQIVNTHGWEYSYAHVAEYWATLPKAIQDYMEFMSEDLDAYIPEEYAREMWGIAQTAIQLGYGDELPLKEILALNFMYEWTTACTSIVSEDSTGQMWHARNMDWNFGGYSLFNVSYIVDFQKNGTTVFTGVQWIGYQGVLSGGNKGFTVTVDQREHYEKGIIWGNLDAIEAGAQTVGFNLRTTLMTQTTFNGALNNLAYNYIAAPCYYNMGGSNPGEGVVITRDRQGNTTNLWKWNSGPQPCCPGAQNWYLVETNYDHWTTDGDGRQEDAINALNAMTQANLTANNLFNVLATPDVLNGNTQYSMVVQNGGPYFQVVGWQ